MEKQKIMIIEESDDGSTTRLFDYTLKPGEMLVMDFGAQDDIETCNYVITVDRTKNWERNNASTAYRKH